MASTMTPTDVSGTTYAHMGLPPFVACPSPSPNAPRFEPTTVRTEPRSETAVPTRPDRGWTSPCCFGCS